MLCDWCQWAMTPTAEEKLEVLRATVDAGDPDKGAGAVSKPTGPYGVVVEHERRTHHVHHVLRGPGVEHPIHNLGFEDYALADLLNTAYVEGQGHPTEWHSDKPIASGYYLVAWRRTADSPPVVSELWFNGGDGRGTWWASRGYMPDENLGRRERVPQEIKNVVAWASMPAPPKALEKPFGCSSDCDKPGCGGGCSQ